MHDCAKDVLAHHDERVTLPAKEREEMRSRRNTNRDRVKGGLSKAEKPTPLEFKSQGSYAMKTMVQHPAKDYDVDDGIYFDKADLVGARGGEMSAFDVRQMVRDAVDDGSFKRNPEVRDNCVRVFYDQGYHVDLPSYRRTISKDIFGKEKMFHELASVEWKVSDARDVTDWFDTENERQSGDADNGRQLRRITRCIKRFARSRSSWEDVVLSGFGITKLVTECFRGNVDREDVSLHDTMRVIRDRLKMDLVVRHPVTPGDTITKGADDSKARFLRDKLTDAIDWLAPLHVSTCTRGEALKCWDKVFNTTYFGERGDGPSARRAGPTDVATSGLIRELGSSGRAQEAVRKDGGGRYA